VIVRDSIEPQLAERSALRTNEKAGDDRMPNSRERAPIDHPPRARKANHRGPYRIPREASDVDRRRVPVLESQPDAVEPPVGSWDRTSYLGSGCHLGGQAICPSTANAPDASVKEP
jgi:hypothetical protein